MTSTPQSGSLGYEFGGFGGFDPFGGLGFGGVSYAKETDFDFGVGFGLGTNPDFGSNGPASGATANTMTGLGSPNGASLVPYLVSSTLTTPLSTSGYTGATGSGSGTTKPVGKHHDKHNHTLKHRANKPAATHTHSKMHTSAKQSVVHDKRFRHSDG